MKQLTNFEKMRLNKQRREEVEKRRIKSAIEVDPSRLQFEMFDRNQKRQHEIFVGMRNDPNANPYVEGPKLGSWWPF